MDKNSVPPEFAYHHLVWAGKYFGSGNYIDPIHTCELACEVIRGSASEKREELVKNAPILQHAYMIFEEAYQQIQETKGRLPMLRWDYRKVEKLNSEIKDLSDRILATLYPERFPELLERKVA